MTLVRFKHDTSLVIGEGRIDFYSAEGGHDWFVLDGASQTSEAVHLSDGLVHVHTRDGLYQVQSNSEAGFMVQKLTER